MAAVADAGIGDDDVEPAHLFDARVHRGLQRVVVADIDLGGVDPPVVPLDQIRGLGQILRRGCGDQIDCVDLLTDVDGDDVGTFLRQPYRVRPALAAGRAGDESDLAFNTSSHCYLNSSLVD